MHPALYEKARKLAEHRDGGRILDWERGENGLWGSRRYYRCDQTNEDNILLVVWTHRTHYAIWSLNGLDDDPNVVFAAGTLEGQVFAAGASEGEIPQFLDEMCARARAAADDALAKLDPDDATTYTVLPDEETRLRLRREDLFTDVSDVFGGSFDEWVQARDRVLMIDAITDALNDAPDDVVAEVFRIVKGGAA